MCVQWSIRNSGTRGKCVMSSATSPRRKSPQDPSGRRLGGNQCQCRRGDEENIFYPSRERNRGREARNLPLYWLRYPGVPSCSLEQLTLYSTGEVNATPDLYTRQGARRCRHGLELLPSPGWSGLWHASLPITDECGALISRETKELRENQI
jgi:hypothetical protein